MKRLINKKILTNELKSIITTILAFLVMDEAATLMNIYNGDFSSTTLLALLMAIIRSIVKTLLTLSFPKLFPARKN